MSQRPRSLRPDKARPIHAPVRRLNCLLAPHSMLEQEARILPQALGAPRSVLRSAWAYLGISCALAYRRVVARDPLAPARGAEMSALAHTIRRRLQRLPLDVLALGVGEGAHEVRLAQHLLGGRTEPLSLCVHDLSAPLLTVAYQRAAQSFAEAQIELWALHADLEELSAHAELLFVPGRQRLVLLLGGTLGELADELRFLRYGLAACAPGDLLVLDVPVAVAGPEEAIWSRQGDAAHRFFEDAREWLTLALGSHLPGLPIEWSVRLSHPETVPGSYAWCAVATVHEEEREREIEVYRCRRYDPRRLAALLASLGWEPVAMQRYGEPLAGELHLYQRRAQRDVAYRRPARGRAGARPYQGFR